MNTHSQYYKDMRDMLISDMLFKGDKRIGLMLWCILPVTLGMFIGWWIADVNS